MKCILATTLVLFTFSVYGQKVDSTEETLLQSFKKIKFWSAKLKQNDIKAEDSLNLANDHFNALLLNHVQKEPHTLKYPFDKLKNIGLKIVTSDDGNFRIFSWDTLTGGTMHNFKNVFQYKNGEVINAEDINLSEGDAGGYYSEIFTLKDDGKNYYLGYFNAIYSTSDSYQSVKAFSIGSKGLDSPKLFKTKSGLTNQLGFNFDFFSVVDREERPVKLIYFDAKLKTLKIPVVLDKGAGQVTNRFITYKFNNQYFVKVST